MKTNLQCPDCCGKLNVTYLVDGASVLECTQPRCGYWTTISHTQLAKIIPAAAVNVA